MAIDVTLHELNIRRDGLRKLDFASHPQLANTTKLDELVKRVSEVGEHGFVDLGISRSKIRNRTAYKITTLEHEIGLRVLSKGLRRLTRVRQSNRLSIINSLRPLLEEGVDYRVVRLDIRRFYESVDTNQIVSQMKSDRGFSRYSVRLFNSFFEKLALEGIPGLPPGMAISAVLGEYVMRAFDEVAEKHPSVYFYARFVDDIVIILDADLPERSLMQTLRKALPSGLSFNKAKTRSLLFDETVLKSGEPSAIKEKLNFLGYEFSIFQRQSSNKTSVRRRVLVDIAPSKVSRIKTKVVRAALRFLDDGNYQDLNARLRLLSGNYSVFDHGKGIRRKAGIYYGYQLADGAESQALTELDDFLRAFLLSSSGPICSRLRKELTEQQRRQLLKLSFSTGFRSKTFYHFPGPRLVKLMSCWAHG